MLFGNTGHMLINGMFLQCQIIPEMLDFDRSMLSGSEFGNKNSFPKKCKFSKENSPPQAKNVWILWTVLVNLRREFKKHAIVISLI